MSPAEYIFVQERQARLNRQQFQIAVREFLQENLWAFSALVIFWVLIGVAVFFMSSMLAARGHVHELQREIQLLRALAS